MRCSLSFLLLSLVCNGSKAWVMVSPVSTTTTMTKTTPLYSTTAAAASGNTKITLDGKEIRGPLTPLGNLVLVKVKDTLTATSGGILLPDQSKERPTEGLVLEVGPGKIHPFTGIRITNPIQAGMSVLYGKYDGKAVEYKGEECQMIRDDDVLLCYTGVSMKLDNVIPVRDYVLVAVDQGKFGDQPTTTSSGVVIAAQVMKGNAPCQGRVVKVGEGRMASQGQFTTSPVQPGDLVKFKDYAGNDVMIEGKPYAVVKMVDILATLKPEYDDEKNQP